MTNSCNQCHKQMTIETPFDVMVCHNPECPNYGLLQVSVEDMLDLEDEFGVGVGSEDDDIEP